MGAAMEIGTELREARQRAGLSAEQVSERTKIRVEKIRALEQNAFEQLPAGIFLDGIVKAYAYEVGYDARAALRRLHGEDVANLEGWVSEADLPISPPKTAVTPVVAPPSGAHVVKPTAAPVVKPAAPVLKPPVEQVLKPAEAQVAKPAVEQVVRPSATQVVKPPAAQVVKPPAAQVVRPSATHVVRPSVAPVMKPVAARVVTPEVARVIEPAPVPIQKPAAAPVMWSEAAGVVEPPATVEPGVASAAAPDHAGGRRSPLRTPAFALLGLFAATGWGLYLYSIMRPVSITQPVAEVRDASAPAAQTASVVAPPSDAVRSTRPESACGRGTRGFPACSERCVAAQSDCPECARRHCDAGAGGGPEDRARAGSHSDGYAAAFRDQGCRTRSCRDDKACPVQPRRVCACGHERCGANPGGAERSYGVRSRRGYASATSPSGRWRQRRVGPHNASALDQQ